MLMMDDGGDDDGSGDDGGDGDDGDHEVMMLMMDDGR